MTAVLEDIKEYVIDKWGTLNTAASPAKLPESHSPNNLNVWMDEKPGSVVTSKGYIKLGEIPSGNPPTLLINFFKTSDGSSQLIVSDNETIWYTTDYANYTVIKTGLSQFFQLRGKVIRDKVWFTNGSDDVATWDGSTYTELDGSGGTPDVPLGKYIEYHDERVWIYGISSDLSALRFSALTDAAGTEIAPENAAAWPTDNELQISEGDADQGTGIFIYRGYLYCSKQYSFWRIVGYDEYTYTRVKTRSSTGTRFQESVQIKDNLVHFIGVDGLYVFDGEESKRISDIIDPSSSEEGVFSFRNLQQTLLNSRFWNVSDSVDIDDGTIPNNLDSSNDEIALIPADDSQSEFNSGTLTRVTADDNPGYLQLDLVATGDAGSLISAGRMAFQDQTSGAFLVGSSSYITDNNDSNAVGFRSGLTGGPNTVVWTVDLDSVSPIGQVIVNNLQIAAGGSGAILISSVEVQVNTGSHQAQGASNGTWVTVGSIVVPASSAYGPTNSTISFATQNAIQVRLIVVATHYLVTITELEVYQAGYEADGKFVSAAIDYSAIPGSFGNLAASIVTNGESYQFFTQSSADGSSWDAEVNLANGAAIGSTVRRYLRWGVYLYSSTGNSTPVIDKVYVGGTYLSEIHDTGGTILQWGAFELVGNAAGQTINAYYRAASTSAGVSAASWTAIVPGAIPNTATSNVFIQIRVELSTADASQAPSVQGFTVNWVLSSSSGAAVLQNVASMVILNRYWLSAATLGASENDIVLVLGKSTAGSPWHKKDFKVLTFCRFLEIDIAGSSEDGSLYRLEYGFSKNGEAMDSYYETKDFSADDFYIKGRELLVSCDRSGPYVLSVGWSTDGGLTYTEKEVDLTRDDGASLSFIKKLNIGFMSDTVRFRLRTNAADQPFSVDSLRNYYKLSPQRGSLQ